MRRLITLQYRMGPSSDMTTRPGAVFAPHLLLPILALLCAPALAAVDIAANVGFTDTFRPGRWTPLIVTVTNRGPDINGELEVQLSGGSELRGRAFVTAHRRALELQRGARKTVQFTVLPHGLSNALLLRVVSGGQELARSEVDLRTRQIADERLLLVLSRDANLDYLNDREDDGLRVLYPHPELLPAHWRGYDAVAAVVVHGVSLERLSAGQFEALRKWIAQGGILAVSGGAEYGLLRTPRLAALLPGMPQGMTRLSADALKEGFSASLDRSHAVHVHRLGAFVGHTRLSASGTPLIVERAFGLGRVLYLTFDVASQPFDRWEGMRALWMDNLRLPALAPGPLNVVDSAGEGPLMALVRAERSDYPSYAIVLLFLVLYLGLLLAGYQYFARSARLPALAPLWCWIAPGLAALAAWFLFGPAMFPRGASAVTMAVIEPLPASGYARLALDVGVYANRSGAMRLEYRGAEPVLYPRQPQRGGSIGDWIIGEGPRPYLEPLDTRRYVLHALQGEDVIAFDLKASVYAAATGPRLVLHNASGRTIEDLRLVFEGEVYEVGSVASGARSERRFARATQAPEPDKAAWRGALKPRGDTSLQSLEAARIVLERRAQAAGERGYPGAGHALLVGYTTSPLRPGGASTDWPRRERALIAYRFAASAEEAPASGSSVPMSQQRSDGPPLSGVVERARVASAAQRIGR